jgi:hypothetical protein
MRRILASFVVGSALTIASGEHGWAQPGSGFSPPPPAVREACKADVPKFCNLGNPFAVRSCILENAKRLQPACRAALQSAGMLPR